MQDRKDISKKVLQDKDLKKIHDILCKMGLDKTHQVFIRKDLPEIIAKIKENKLERVIFYDPSKISMLH